MRNDGGFDRGSEEGSKNRCISKAEVQALLLDWMESGCERKRSQGCLQGFRPEKLVEWICCFLRWRNCRRNRFGGRSPVSYFQHVKLELAVDYSKWRCWVWIQSSGERSRVETLFWELLAWGDIKARSWTGREQACPPMDSALTWSQVKAPGFSSARFPNVSIWRSWVTYFFQKDSSALLPQLNAPTAGEREAADSDFISPSSVPFPPVVLPYTVFRFPLSSIG